MFRRFDPYHEIPDAADRRLAIVALHSEGWNVKSIAGYLRTYRSTVCRTLKKWTAEGVHGLEDKPRGGGVRCEAHIAAKQQLEDEKVLLSAAQAPEGFGAAKSADVERAIDEAFVSGYRLVMLVAAAMALAIGVSAAILIEGKRTKGSAHQPILEREVTPDP